MLVENINFSDKIISRDDFAIIRNFSTGNKYPEAGLADYLKTDAIDDLYNGNGVTHLVVDEKRNAVVGYYTICASALPYYYRTKEDDNKYYQVLCSIPAVEIRMFAIDIFYQDVFIDNMPISAIVFRHIISEIYNLSESTLGVKAIYLHTLSSAKSFYQKNGMKECEEYFAPFASEDDDLAVMYALLKECNIVYEE